MLKFPRLSYKLYITIGLFKLESKCIHRLSLLISRFIVLLFYPCHYLLKNAKSAIFRMLVWVLTLVFCEVLDIPSVSHLPDSALVKNGDPPQAGCSGKSTSCVVGCIFSSDPNGADCCLLIRNSERGLIFEENLSHQWFYFPETQVV